MEVVIPEVINKSASPIITRSSVAYYLDYLGWYARADTDTPRFNYRFLEDNTSVGFEGLLLEPQRTNLWTNNATILGLNVVYTQATTKTITLPSTCFAFVFSFYGTGSVTVTYTYPPVGLISEMLVGIGENQRVWKAFPSGSADITFTVDGIVNRTQVEPLDFTVNTPSEGLLTSEAIAKYAHPTSWIPNTGSTATTRAEEIISESGIMLNDFTEDTALYSGIIMYAKGQQVSYQYSIYESMIDNNIGIVPSGLDTDLNWNYVRPSNNLALLDLATDASSKINGRGHFSIVLKDKLIDNATMLQLSAYDADLSITHFAKMGVLTKHSHKESNSNNSLSSSIMDGALYADTAASYGSIISFRISSEIDRDFEMPIDPLEEVGVSELIFGLKEDIGTTLYGVSSSIVDYSVKTTNVFGTTTYTKRGFSKRVSGDINIPRSQQNAVLNLLYSLRATTALWIFSDNIDDSSATLVFGAYNSFSLKISYPSVNVYNIEIEGLVL